MFTGIVEEMGTVETFDGSRLRVRASVVLAGAALGDSIAVNGCCLTVVEHGHGWWQADISAETLDRTALSDLKVGSSVNLERSVRLTDRLSGHIVQGHVDGVGEVLRPVPDLRVRIPAALMRYVVEKGSITVDGVSLTVVNPADEVFSASIIPHTAAVTTLGGKRQGDCVNIEVDVLAKYVERLLAERETR